MSQTLEQVRVKEIEKNLPTKLKNLEEVFDAVILSKLVKELDDKLSAYVVEIRSDRSNNRIFVIDHLKKNIYKNRRPVHVDLLHSANYSLRKNSASKTRNKSFPSVKDFEIHESHRLAEELRKMVGLKPLKGRGRVNAVQDLAYMLKDYSDDGDNPVDAVKQARQS